MITVKLGDGVENVTPPAAIHISNLILDAMKESNLPFGKVVVNYDELTFYKFGLKTGMIRFEDGDLECRYGGPVYYTGTFPPYINDIELFKLVEQAR
jgi:hypothetical protein